MPATPPRLSRPVFLSSTFRDMHAERDWLRARVFPEIEERLRQRRCDLEAIDLRWGVETVSAGEEQAKELLVLKVCLAEIERSRPFLIVLMGDRYGWVPPAERTAAATQEAGYKTDVAGKSVTALEIEFGVLDSPDQRRRSHFYFREPLPYGRMPPEVAAQFSEAHNPAPGAAEAAARLDALKARIQRQLPDRVRPYRAAWDANAQQVTGLEAFGQMVLEDLWRDLCDEIPETPPAVTWQDEERFTLDEFIARNTRNFVGREEVTKELLGLALSLAEAGGPWGACVTGVTGSGKSAFFAQLARRLRETDALVLAHAAGISVRAGQVDALLRRWVQELAAHLGVPERIEEKSSGEEVEKAFHQLLGQAAARTRVVLLIDALNQFDPSVRAQHLTWLPKLWPPNARLIATAIPGTESKALLGRDGVVEVELPRLSEREAQAIAVAVCRRYHRSVHPDVLGVLLAKKLPDGAPAAGIPLWLELAIEELNLLDADDFRRMDREFSGTPEQRLHQLLLTVAGELPPDVEGLYGWMLTRAEELHGTLWATAFANLIALSRNGWRESDLEAMLPAFTGEAWDPLRFAALRRTFRAHIVRRGALGQWDFFHAQARAAVLGRNLPDEAARRNIHAALADHLEALSPDDPLRQSEVMVHLIAADDKPRAARLFGRQLTGGELEGATRALAQHIIAGLGRDPNPGLAWVLDLLAQEGLEGEQIGWLCNNLNFFVHDALVNDTGLPVRRALIEGTRRAMIALVEKGPTTAGWQRGLSASHHRVGELLMAQGDAAGALTEYRAALAITERLAASDSTNPDWQRDLSVCHNRLGDVLIAHGDAAGALEAYRADLAISERLAAMYPTHPDLRRDVALGHEKVGKVLLSHGNLAAALHAYQTSLLVRQRLAASDPTNVVWQADLGASQERVGEVLFEQGDLRGALRAFMAVVELRERLTRADPTNKSWQFDLAVSQGRVGEVLAGLGELTEALRFHQATQAALHRLAVGDPTNADWQRDLAVSHEKLGDLLLAQDDVAAALRAFMASLPIQERLVAADPTNAIWQRDLSVSHERVGDALRQQGELDGALRAYRESLAIRERLSAADAKSAPRQSDLAASHERVGMVLQAQGDLEGALESHQDAVFMRDRVAAEDPTNAGWQRDLAVSHYNLAILHRQMGDGVREGVNWLRCRAVLRRMRAGGMFLDPPLAQLLEQLERI